MTRIIVDLPRSAPWAPGERGMAPQSHGGAVTVYCGGCNGEPRTFTRFGRGHMCNVCGVYLGWLVT
jgi:hypothetical protein